MKTTKRNREHFGNGNNNSVWNKLDTFTKVMVVIIGLLLLGILLYNILNYTALRERA